MWRGRIALFKLCKIGQPICAVTRSYPMAYGKNKERRGWLMRAIPLGVGKLSTASEAVSSTYALGC